MSQQNPPTYAEKVKQSLEQTQAPAMSNTAKESISRSKAQVLEDIPSVSAKDKGAEEADTLRQQALNRFGLREGEEDRTGSQGGTKSEPFSQEAGSEGGPSLVERTKQKVCEASEPLKESVSRTEEKVHDVISGGIQQKAGEAWGETTAAVTPEENHTSIMDRLTTSIAEGSKKMTETAQSMKKGIKSAFGFGGQSES